MKCMPRFSNSYASVVSFFRSPDGTTLELYLKSLLNMLSHRFIRSLQASRTLVDPPFMKSANTKGLQTAKNSPFNLSISEITSSCFGWNIVGGAIALFRIRFVSGLNLLILFTNGPKCVTNFLRSRFNSLSLMLLSKLCLYQYQITMFLSSSDLNVAGRIASHFLQIQHFSF